MAEEATRIERAAAALLRWLEQQNGPWQDDRVPVDALVAAIGLDVARFSPALHPGTLGYLEPGEELIFLRAGLAEPVRRFTLAHELGHAVLHRTDGPAARTAGTWLTQAAEETDDESYESICGDEDLVAALETTGTKSEMLAAGQAYSARAQREGEANAFAAALLLPADRLRQAIASLRASDSKRNIARHLATRFGVSEDGLLRRLSALLTLPASSPTSSSTSMDAGQPLPHAAPTPALDDEQRAAAAAETPALIIAGPGSGKTTTLVARVAYLVREGGVVPERVLALTFSRKAAREMADRLGTLLGDTTGDDADTSDEHGPLAQPPGPTVSTIHAFCGDMLRRYAPLVGLRPDFRVIGEAEGYFLLRRVASGLHLQHYMPLTAPALYFPDLLRAISRAKDSLIEPEDYAATVQTMLNEAKTPDDRIAAERAQELAAVYAAYQQALAARGDADFGDLVRLCVRLFRDNPDVLAAVRQRFGAVLVDEFQDINRAMGILLHLLTGEDGTLWAVGDADQAIYRFRGASPANLALFTREYSGAHVHHLSGNYRSTPTIIAAAESIARSLLPGDNRLSLRPLRPAGEVSQRVTLAVALDEASEHAGLVKAIASRHEGGYAWRDQAVLCRTRRQARAIVEALHQADIPTRVAAPLLDQPLIRDVLAVLSLLTESAGAGLLRAGDLPGHRFSRAEARNVLATAREAHTSARALLMGHLGEVARLSGAGKRGLRALGKALVELRTAPDVATGLARYYFSATGLGFTLMEKAACGNDEARMQSGGLSHLIALARLFDDSQRATEDEREGAPAASADWNGFLEYVRVLLSTPQGRAGIEDDPAGEQPDAVWVLTVHASKGLEFPVVYVPGLANGRFPSQRQWERVKPPLAEDDEPTDATHDEEEACLFYVAITRARDELILSRPERLGRRSARPSPFLAPIERRLGSDLPRLEWPATSPRASEQERGGDDGHISVPGSRANDETLSVYAIETYARCPRQYAYRFVEGLSASDGNLPRMRRGVLEALRLLHSEPGGNSVSPDQTNANGKATLEEALERFDEVWADQPAAAQQPGTEGSNGVHNPEDNEVERPFHDVYRRYGRRIVESAWQELAERNTANGVAGRQVGFEEALAIPIGRRTIALTVDRVERDAPAPESGATTQPGRPAATHYIRDRLGAAADRPDLRALLYTMAAEQQTGKGERVEVSQRNMATGAREPVTIRPRQRENLHDELTSAIEGILRNDFTPRPEAHRCQSCPFLLICPAQ
ncbi:MAG TPA: ATP-dependent helicase [Ktedonobacterales bacterium]|nr:ATP-dependent helicase [Ktedonobacterales bacterium]